jgi:hypothetical protein
MGIITHKSITAYRGFQTGLCIGWKRDLRDQRREWIFAVSVRVGRRVVLVSERNESSLFFPTVRHIF